MIPGFHKINIVLRASNGPFRKEVLFKINALFPTKVRPTLVGGHRLTILPTWPPNWLVELKFPSSVQMSLILVSGLSKLVQPVLIVHALR